jgi:hypothetical protein
VRLEPYEGKLSRTVLRREGRSNPPDLAAKKVKEGKRYLMYQISRKEWLKWLKF